MSDRKIRKSLTKCSPIFVSPVKQKGKKEKGGNFVSCFSFQVEALFCSKDLTGFFSLFLFFSLQGNDGTTKLNQTKQGQTKRSMWCCLLLCPVLQCVLHFFWAQNFSSPENVFPHQDRTKTLHKTSRYSVFVEDKRNFTSFSVESLLYTIPNIVHCVRVRERERKQWQLNLALGSEWR